MQTALAGTATGAAPVPRELHLGSNRPGALGLRGNDAHRSRRAMNQAGFEMMVRAYSSDLFRFAFWLCRNRWQAQDVVQETFAAAWRARDSLRNETATKGWLFSILRNEHARIYQRKQLDTVDAEVDELPQVADGGFERVELEECLRKLPDSHREPLMLQVLGGFNGREIADMMGITEQNVMTRLTRARQMLQRLASPRAAPRVKEM